MSDDTSEQHERSPLEQAVEHAVDVFVYAPIGLLFEGASLLPQLVEKGKSQVTMARMMGKFAVTQGRGEADKLAGKVGEQALGVLARFGQSPTAHPGAIPDSGPRSAPEATAPPSAAAPPVAASDGAAEVASDDRDAGAAIAVGSLAIPDYDGLSASHVVNRLAGLAKAELEAVRLYELANRGRKTILSKVSQLQNG